MYSAVMQNIAADETPQMTSCAAAAADVSVVGDSQVSFRAGSSSTPGMDDAITGCEVLSMSECQSVADFAVPEPAMPAADAGHTDQYQDCSSGGTVLFYATADEAIAYMFYRCFFAVFLFFFVFLSFKKYETTVLGNG